jgi:ABC-type multidrug transport system ATPase subunit
MSVRDHLALACLTSGGDREQSRDRADRFGLAPWWESDAATLSAGNLRKLWIIMCTTGSFGLVLLDEPYLGLDATAASVLSAEVADWALERLVVLVTHTAPPDLRMDARVTVSSGRVLQSVPQPVGSVR